jgi:GNAT superfamily N-acetyltransferase
MYGPAGLDRLTRGHAKRVRQEALPMVRSGIDFVRGECREIDEYLSDRIDEFNYTATGHFDGESFAAVHRDVAGTILAGVSGYTWGGCCHVSNLWVAEQLRGQGWGTRLLEAAEQNAVRRRCTHVILWTHSFQAPAFYERLGYVLRAQVDDHPPGHKDLVYVKRLAPSTG